MLSDRKAINVFLINYVFLYKTFNPIILKHMRTTLSFAVIILIMVACEPNRLKTDFENYKVTDSLTLKSIKLDTTKKLIAQLPVLFDSTEFLIHPICLVNVGDLKSKRTGSYSSSYDSYDYSEYDSYNKNEDYISGNITNIVFENIKTREQKLLTNTLVKINSVHFLRELFRKTKKQYILYTLTDGDSNFDRKWNNEDIESLYISKIDGSDFKKLTINTHDYSGGEMITENLRYYFQTIEDINRDGLFNKSDTYHYFYIDFASDTIGVVEYNPLQLISE